MIINNVLKIVIIICIILLIFNLILYIPINIKVSKRGQENIIINVYVLSKVFKKSVYHKEIKKQNNSGKIKITNFLFSSNLNIDLKGLKDKNFFIYLILEYGVIKKLTLIPSISTSSEEIFPIIGFGSWIGVMTIKRYIESTFKYIENDYYQMMFDNQNKGIYFELEVEIRLMAVFLAIVKKHHLLLKTIKRKVDYER